LLPKINSINHQLCVAKNKTTTSIKFPTNISNFTDVYKYFWFEDHSDFMRNCSKMGANYNR